MEEPILGEVTGLMENGYVPFGEIARAIPWPTNPELRAENDAEHSFALALVASAVAERLGLDVGKVCQMATVHDFVEVFAGDVSVWDDAGRIDKPAREAAAVARIKTQWSHFPWLAQTIEEYERLDTPEACLVYALDKFLAIQMILQGDGYFWKNASITFADHLAKVEEVRPPNRPPPTCPKLVQRTPVNNHSPPTRAVYT